MALSRHDFQLVSGEFQNGVPLFWKLAWAGQILLVLSGLASAFFLRSGSNRVAAITGVAAVVVHSAYITVITLNLGSAIPESVDVWILSIEGLLLAHWGFSMPGIMYGYLLFAGRESSIRPGKAVAGGIGLIALPVLVLWLILNLLSDLLGGTDFLISQIAIGFALATMIIGYGVFLLGMSMARIALRNRDAGLSTWTLLVPALVLPVAGLLLNRMISFPCDLQNPWVYGLTIVNGLVVAWPGPASAKGRMGLLFLQTLLFPFTLYFFFAFLPYLPLAVPAMLAVGAGFLIVAPTLLFIVHLWRITDLFRAIPGRAVRIGLVGIALPLIPAVLIFQMTLDRQAIHRALSFTYAPSPQAVDAPPAPARVLRVLRAVLMAQQGVNYPILTPLYRNIVLDGMVLPEERIQVVGETFFGDEAEELLADLPRNLGMFSGPRARTRGRTAALTPITEEKTVEIASIDFDHQPGEAGATLQIALDVHVTGNVRQGEFLGSLELPPGVWIDSAELLVGTEWKTADLRERRAAEWVYRMIRTERVRDPLLITLASPQMAEIRIFPVGRGETREARIRLRSLFPEMPALNFDVEHEWKPTAPPSAISILTEGTFAFTGVLRAPSLNLTPELHLVVDRSTGSLSPEAMLNKIGSTMATMPPELPVKLWTVAGGVTEWSELGDSKSIESQLNSRELPKPKGGWIPAHAILHILEGFEKQLQEETPTTYPFIVLVTHRELPPSSVDLIRYFDTHFNLTQELALQSIAEEPRAPGTIQAHLMRRGNYRMLLATASEEMTVPRWTYTGTDGGKLEMYDPASDEFRTLEKSTDPSPAPDAATKADLLTRFYAERKDPATAETNRARRITEAQHSRVLTPDTALIVLETTAQERFLAEMEEKGKTGMLGLDFSETPEPRLLLILPVTLWLLWPMLASPRKLPVPGSLPLKRGRR